MRVPAIIALTLICSVVLLAEPALRGTVTDEAGASISGAVIRIHWDPSGSSVGLSSNIGIKKDVMVTSGKDGSFSIGLPSGFYDVFVSSPAFTPVCRKIRIRDRENAVTFDPRLPVDALVTNELGFQIEPLIPK